MRDMVYICVEQHDYKFEERDKGKKAQHLYGKPGNFEDAQKE